MKSLTVRAANIGTAAGNVLLEVFHALNAADGVSQQVLYVQRLVSVAPDQLHTFDNIFPDLDSVTVRVTTSDLGQALIAVSVASRDAQRRVIPGFVSTNPGRFDVPERFPQGNE